MGFIPLVGAEEASSVAGTLAGSISQSDIQGVLNEVVSLLPTVLPVMIGFIAIRKGISFLIGMLRSA